MSHYIVIFLAVSRLLSFKEIYKIEIKVLELAHVVTISGALYSFIKIPVSIVYHLLLPERNVLWLSPNEAGRWCVL